jgi:rubrerythrin
MMSRLIDADELKTAFPCGEEVRTESVRATIDHAPTVPQRMRGRWKRTYLDHVAMGERPSIFYCSACNQCIAYPTNFCPSCGADMRESINV